LEKDTMTITEAAKVLGVSRPTILEMGKRGKLTIERNPAYETGRGPARIPREDVERILAKRIA
jgi:excisionase family DNA binding protein